MRFSPAFKRAWLSFGYAGLFLHSLQTLWPILPQPVLAWILVPAAGFGCGVGLLGRLLARRAPEPVTPLEVLLLVNACLLELVILLEIPNPGI